MNKPILIYYSVLGFQQTTIETMKMHFQVVEFSNPDCEESKSARDAEALLAPMGYSFGKVRLQRYPNLKVIGTPTTGTVHIDLAAAEECGISICSLKAEKELLNSITPTAELTWGLLMCVSRQIPAAFNSVKQGEWIGSEFGKRTPRMLSKMTLGIVGLGRLGAWVARYGHGFRMPVCYYDPYVSSDKYARCQHLEKLAEKADIVSVHVHLSNETTDLIGDSFLSRMKPGGFLINTARGGIVNENALLKALETGHLAGAGLDMLEGEHLPGFSQGLNNHPLVVYARNHNNLILTPKIGGATVDAWARTEIHIIRSMAELLERRCPK